MNKINDNNSEKQKHSAGEIIAGAGCMTVLGLFGAGLLIGFLSPYNNIIDGVRWAIFPTKDEESLNQCSDDRLVFDPVKKCYIVISEKDAIQSLGEKSATNLPYAQKAVDTDMTDEFGIPTLSCEYTVDENKICPQQADKQPTEKQQNKNTSRYYPVVNNRANKLAKLYDNNRLKTYKRLMLHKGRSL